MASWGVSFRRKDNQLHDRFSYSFIYFNSLIPYPLICLNWARNRYTFRAESPRIGHYRGSAFPTLPAAHSAWFNSTCYWHPWSVVFGAVWAIKNCIWQIMNFNDRMSISFILRELSHAFINCHQNFFLVSRYYHCGCFKLWLSWGSEKITSNVLCHSSIFHKPGATWIRTKLQRELRVDWMHW